MKRVASELDALDGPEKEPNREFLVLQGVRFAFRVHQVIYIQLIHLYLSINQRFDNNCTNKYLHITYIHDHRGERFF